MNKELRSWTVLCPIVKPKKRHVAPSTVILRLAKIVALWTGIWT